MVVTAHIAAMHGSFKYICQVVPTCTTITWFLGPT